MLVKIEKDKYLNADFVVVFFLTDKNMSEDNSLNELAGPWKIVARMLDGSSQLLKTGKKEEMEAEFIRMVNDANKRIRKIKYEDD